MKRRARGTRRPQWQRGVMNKGEQRYADHLDTLKAKGHIAAWYYEAVSFLIGPNCRLTPDFEVHDMEGYISYHEVKANRKGRWHGEDDAKVKMKAFVDKYPMRPLFVVWPKDRTYDYWCSEEIGG